MMKIIFAPAIAAGLCAAMSCSPLSENTGAVLDKEDAAARIDDGGETPDKPPPKDDGVFPDTAIGKLLNEHMIALATPGETIEEADARYAASIKKLRASPKEAASALVEAYEAIDESRYFDRWAIVKTLADLETGEGYGGLSKTAFAEIPREKSEDPHHFSTVEDEIMIRLRAIDGLTALAKKGDQRAEKDLYALATATGKVNSAVQRRAIKGYLSAGRDRERAAALKRALPAELHDLITLEPTDRQSFAKQVEALAVIAEEDTLSDGAEEAEPSGDAPATSKTRGEPQ